MLTAQDLTQITRVVRAVISQDVSPQFVSIKSDIVNIKSDITNIKGDIQILKTDSAELREEFSELRDEMRDFRDEVLTREDTTIGEIKAMRQEFAFLGNRVTRLENARA